MYDVTATGELLIDFTRNGLSEQNNRIYEAKTGGAPCNVLAMLGKLGYKTAFIGKVGNDEFGKLLKNTISEQKIDSIGLVMDPDAKTTLAFVDNDETGDRSFSFYRKIQENFLPARHPVQDPNRFRIHQSAKACFHRLHE